MAATKFFLLLTLGFLSSTIAMKLSNTHPVTEIIPVMSADDDDHFFEGAKNVSIYSTKMEQLYNLGFLKFLGNVLPNTASMAYRVHARQKTVGNELKDSLKFVVTKARCNKFVNEYGWDQCKWEYGDIRATCVIEASAAPSWDESQGFELTCNQNEAIAHL